ncbi:MAG: DUF465 domain-containing protein [Ferrimonas sp.]
MLGEIHSLLHDFPEHRDAIVARLERDPAFAEDNRRYNELDKQIRELELADSPIGDDDMQDLKHQRSELKDLLYQRLQHP